LPYHRKCDLGVWKFCSLQVESKGLHPLVCLSATPTITLHLNASSCILLQHTTAREIECQSSSAEVTALQHECQSASSQEKTSGQQRNQIHDSTIGQGPHQYLLLERQRNPALYTKVDNFILSVQEAFVQTIRDTRHSVPS